MQVKELVEKFGYDVDVELFDDDLENNIKIASSHISVQYPDYQYLASNLKLISLNIEKVHLYDFITNNIKLGVYDSNILTGWTTEQIDELDKHIDHKKDFSISYAGMSQLVSKYLIKKDGKVLETPQYAFMIIAMCLFQYDKNKMLAKDMYDALSDGRLSLATPIMSGLRSPVKQYSSCVLIEAGDSIISISEVVDAILKYVSKKAGIGVNIGRIRAIGEPIKGGAVHTGLVPFIKLIESAVKSCSQGGIRGGAATVFFPIWHYEVEDLLNLKNNKGTDENRARHLDYCVQMHKVFYERFINDEYITLLSPDPDLYNAFFTDDFEHVYKKYEASDLRKKRIKARELFAIIARERLNTGRLYIQNVDHCNTHGMFKTPVKQSNLCVEIVLPTAPLSIGQGEISLCTLGAINAFCDFKSLSKLLVRALDNLLEIQDYPAKVAEKSTKNRRPLGIGINNFAAYLAHQKLKWKDALQTTHDLFEELQYELLTASCELAEERGSCRGIKKTKYYDGVLNIDNYKKDVDDFGCQNKKDWEKLRARIKRSGLRNSTVSAQMPCETSSQVSNATNGIEPVRDLVTIKGSKDGYFRQLVPHPHLEYERSWEISNKDYLTLVAIMQKFVDQSISANTNYLPSNYKDDKIPLSEIIKDLLFSYKYGLKTLYYCNTQDNSCDSCVL